MKGDFRILSYLFANILVFYTIPILLNNTENISNWFILLIPTLCLITAIVFGIKYSFKYSYPFLVALTFAPTIYLFYNETATIYLFMYAIIALIGNYIGSIFNNTKKLKN